MTYNLLDLPSRVSDTVTGDFSERTYLYDGTKTAVYCGEEGHVYAGSMVFRHGDGYEFESTTFGGGRIVGDGGTLTPMCHITDSNGSTRCIVDLSDGDAVERDDYYPFGARVDDLLPKLASNRYRFSGKEDETGPGEGLVDFGHRIYDPETARWTARDPLADKYPGHSPYSFCLDDPINHVDPQGDSIAVLFANTLFGHVAILIQETDDSGERVWYLYSINSNTIPGHDNQTHTNRSSTVLEFLNGSGNKKKNGYSSSELLSSVSSDRRYSNAYVFDSTEDQENSARKTILEIIDKQYR